MSVVIIVAEVLNSKTALTPTEGDEVYHVVFSELKKDQKAIIDFSGIDVMTSAFLNAAIGQLYYSFTSEDLNRLLSIENLSTNNITLLKKVIQRAKQYFEDKSRFEDSIDISISNDND